MNPELIQLLKNRYQITFHNQKWLEEAFTHSSYVNENRGKDLQYNERIEFLGDAVLELIVSNYLFRKYPNMPEGKLTKLRSSIVREDSLAMFAKECGFDQYIRLGKGEENSNARQRPSLLCDLFEAFIGALYMDQGLESVVSFLNIVMFPKVEQGIFSYTLDNKTYLQEQLQKNGAVNIEYRLVKEEGPAHDKEFFVEVYANGNLIGQGSGRNKKTAEQEAARQAIQRLYKDQKTTEE